MLISIDLAQIRRHLDILRDEVESCRNMTASLNRICQQLQADPAADITFVRGQQELVQRHTEYILRRIDLLESVADRFQSAKRVVAVELSDIESALHNLDSWVI